MGAAGRWVGAGLHSQSESHGREGHRFSWILMEFLWIPMDFDGIPMDFYGFSWILRDFDGISTRVDG